MNDTQNIFEFLMVMVSIIIGFGVTEILGGSARLLRARTKAKPYWLHTVLVIGVFMALLALWWERWGLRIEDNWTFPGLLFMLFGPIGVYLIASLAFPDQVEGCDFRDYYFRNAGLIWIIAGITTILATLYYPLFLGGDLINPDNLPSLLQVLIALVLVFQKRPIIHAIGVPLFFISVVSDQLIFRFFINYN